MNAFYCEDEYGKSFRQFLRHAPNTFRQKLFIDLWDRDNIAEMVNG
jgi:hypothetical protein